MTVGLVHYLREKPWDSEFFVQEQGWCLPLSKCLKETVEDKAKLNLVARTHACSTYHMENI